MSERNERAMGILRAIGDIREEWILDAELHRKDRLLLRKILSAAAAFIFICGSTAFLYRMADLQLSGESTGSTGGSAGGTGSGITAEGSTAGALDGGETSVDGSAPGFTAYLDPSIAEQIALADGVRTDLERVVKLYQTTPYWYEEEVTDFADALLPDPIYMQTDGVSCSYYRMENGAPSFIFGATYDHPDSWPISPAELTDRQIEDDLTDIDYTDYICIHSERLLMVWVRGGEEDLLLTYPSRPDLMDLQPGELYTVAEVADALRKLDN